MSQLPKGIDLLAKQQPRQERAKRTYETILNSAAELLLEVGVERISTNLIAERAGVTVPALYRYFPNKYAVIHALGVDLMQRQNSAFQEWLADVWEAKGPEGLLAEVPDGLAVVYTVTRDTPGGIEIFNALRAMAPLRELRIASRREAAVFLAQQLADFLQYDLSEPLLLKAHLTVDVACCLVESALEDSPGNVEAILREGAVMLVSYWSSVFNARALN